jgi:anti-sigma regulatory factor (Ser/Thr protein kinase)
LSAIVTKTIAPLQPILDINSVSISVEVANLKVVTDANLLQIILRNLLTNAIKYSPTKGQINIRTAAQADKILLYVEDDGGGIEDTILSQLFEHKDNVSIAQKGSGLGLEIVKDLCDKLNIVLQVSNKPTGGAVFMLVLPAATRQAIGQEQQDSETAQQKMLSDKDKAFLKPYAQHLQQLEVFEASSIQQILSEVSAKNNTVAVAAWLQLLRLALLHNDEAQYQQAITSVLGSE